jgi:excisionase family DNA binding protein
MTGLQFVVGAEHAPILDAALPPLLRRYREAGMQAPADIVELAKWARLVTSGLALAPTAIPPDDAPMVSLLSFTAVATELGCSLSKVKKLVADGKLATVDFDGVRRVHRDDLEVFLQALRAQKLHDRLEVKAPAPAFGRRRQPETLEAS